MKRTRPIKSFAFYVSGDEADSLGSILMRQMADHLGYPVIVETAGKHHHIGATFEGKRK